jgi:hypothetical protein
MNKQEMRRLRMQALLMGGLIGGCVIAAVLTASQRWIFEKYCREKYLDLPGSLRSIAEAAEEGHVEPKLFQRLNPQERLLLYDDWMTRAEPRPRQTPKALTSVAPELYLSRAERTLICGNAQQREGALEFLRLAERAEAAAALERACRWWKKRNVPEAADQIQEAIDRSAGAQPEAPVESGASSRQHFLQGA